jgi:hypothetical protein
MIGGINMGEMKCLECGHIGETITRSSYECDDADGNRGMWITEDFCEKCGSDDLTDEFDEDEIDD